MSSILKALEKVEESQARRSGGGGFVKGRERRPLWVLPVGIVGGAAVAALATFAAMGGFSHHAKREQVATAAPVAGPVEPAAAPRPEASSAPATALAAQNMAAPQVVAEKVTANPVTGVNAKHDSATALSAAKALPTSAAAHKAKQKKAKASPVAKALPAAPAAKGRHAAVQAKESHGAAVRSVPLKSAQQPAVVMVAPAAAPKVAAERAPEMKVTGIAWQKDSASSVAMVNGRPMQQGNTVDGYKVERIFEDKVRLSGGKGSIDVPLSAAE